MEIKHPLVIQIGIPVVIVLSVVFIIIRIFRSQKANGGSRVANSSYIRTTKLYKRLRITNLVLTIILMASLILSFVMSIFLVARPYRTEDRVEGIRRRDIFLNLDVSYSIYDLNNQVCENFKDIVEGLNGDRVGITIYNTTTVLYVPLTDDYDYVINKLDQLQEYFTLQAEYAELVGDAEYYYQIPEEDMPRVEELIAETARIDEAVTVNSWDKGSSLIGEGLATCLSKFPELDSDEKRTRVIIMCTDNCEEAYSMPIVRLPEACELCESREVTLYGIFPSYDMIDSSYSSEYQEHLNEYKSGVLQTGGEFYIASNTLPVDTILEDVKKQEAMLQKEIVVTREIDLPEKYFAIMVISLITALATGTVLKR